MTTKRNHNTFAILTVCLGLICAQAGLTQTCVDYGEHLHWIGEAETGDYTRAVAVQNLRAYVADRNTGVSVVDFRYPESAFVAGQVETPGHASGIDVAGRHAFVADFEYGLAVVDVFKSNNPHVVAQVELPGHANAVSVVDGYAYVADFDDALHIVDVKHPTEPTLVGSLGDLPGSPNRVAVSGDLAYVADGGGGLLIVDVTDRSAPVIISTIAEESIARSVAVAGDRVYLGTAEDFQVIDVSDPTAPVLLGLVELTVGVLDISLAGDLAYVAHHGSVGVFDISDDAVPVWLGRHKTKGASLALAMVNNTIHVASRGAGLQILTAASLPPATTERSGNGYIDDPLDVAYQGGYVYVADSGGVVIMTAPPPPGVPEPVGGFGGAGWAAAVAVEGDYAYLADGTGQLVIGDVSTPLAYQVSAVETPGHAWDVAVAGDVAMVAYSRYSSGVPSEGGIMFVDVQDPRSPQVLSEFELGSGVWRVATDGRYTYAATGHEGAVIIDAADPAAPVVTASVPIQNGNNEIAVLGDLLYVANRDLVIIDVRDRTAPFIKSTTRLLYDATGLAVTEQYAYVSVTVGMHILDISRPRTPFTYSTVSYAGFSNGIALGSGRVHVAVWGGIEYFPRGCEVGLVDVSIDIEPGIDGNPIDCSSTNPLPVALLTTPEFDALDVDHASVVFGPGEAQETRMWDGVPFRHEIDADDDGDIDLLFSFRIPDTGLDCTETEVTLRGWTFDGREVVCTAPMQGVNVVAKRPGWAFSLVTYPNPFNPSTTISFELPEATTVNLRVYDLSGRLVRTLLAGEVMPTGRNEVVWNGRDNLGGQVATGVYFYRMDAGVFSATRRMMLIK